MTADEALTVAAAELRSEAMVRFERHGAHDIRGAAFWDAASYIDEVLRLRLAGKP